jgi:hypothetical protein
VRIKEGVVDRKPLIRIGKIKVSAVWLGRALRKTSGLKLYLEETVFYLLADLPEDSYYISRFT